MISVDNIYHEEYKENLKHYHTNHAVFGAWYADSKQITSLTASNYQHSITPPIWENTLLKQHKPLKRGRLYFGILRVRSEFTRRIKNNSNNNTRINYLKTFVVI